MDRADHRACHLLWSSKLSDRDATVREPPQLVGERVNQVVDGDCLAEVVGDDPLDGCDLSSRALCRMGPALIAERLSLVRAVR